MSCFDILFMDIYTSVGGKKSSDTVPYMELLICKNHCIDIKVLTLFHTS